FERLHEWSYAYEVLPSALFGFTKTPTVETEVMVFWSQDSPMRHGKFKKTMPLRNKRHPSPAFANFIYQVVAKVDLNDIVDDHSWVVLGHQADQLNWD